MKQAVVFLLLFCLGLSSAVAVNDVLLRTGDFEISRILEGIDRTAAPGEQVSQASAPFIDTPYAANTLGGGPGEPERLVANLSAVDCFTLIDYVEAMRRSAAAEQFVDQLVQLRYKGGNIDWAERRHFLTEWAAAGSGWLEDVTSTIGAGHAVTVTRQLNRDDRGGMLLPGVPVQEREITYIPGEEIDGKVLDRLQTGDYLGLYTHRAGLDVTHVGIVIRRGDRLFLRHASLTAERVVDSDLAAYLSGRPGIVVIRPVAK